MILRITSALRSASKGTLRRRCALIRLLSCLFLLLVCSLAQTGTPSASMAPNPQPVEAMSPNTLTPISTIPSAGAGTNRTPLTNVLLPPRGKTTLLGGVIGNVDHVRDRLVLEVYGGGRTTVLFDERTRVLHDGKPTSVDDLKSRERVYVDTTLDGTDIFARTVRIAEEPTGKSNGQIVAFEASNGRLTLRDALSPEGVELHVSAKTEIQRGDQAATAADLRPGTLVALTFTPGVGGTPEVSRISLLASPGSVFVFAGRIEHLDLHRGLIVLTDPRDNQSYEISVDSSARRLTQNLRQGLNVTVQTTFNGVHYQASDITINPAATQ
jgi:hypothetical protein